MTEVQKLPEGSHEIVTSAIDVTKQLEKALTENRVLTLEEDTAVSKLKAKIDQAKDKYKDNPAFTNVINKMNETQQKYSFNATKALGQQGASAVLKMFGS